MKLATAFVTLAVGCAVAFPAVAQQITGAGATFPAPIYTKWGEAAKAAVVVVKLDRLSRDAASRDRSSLAELRRIRLSHETAADGLAAGAAGGPGSRRLARTLNAKRSVQWGGSCRVIPERRAALSLFAGQWSRSPR